MRRVTPPMGRPPRRAEYLLVSALTAIVLSYVLGYRLEWAAPSAPPPPAALAAPADALRAAVDGANEAQASQPQEGDPRDWGRMTARLDELASRYRGRVAVFLKDLKDGRTWMYHPDQRFPAASLVKVPIMACAFYKIHDGQWALNDAMVVTRKDRRGGSGSLKWSRSGTRLTLRQILEHMIMESDNTAAAMLLRAMGFDYVQKHLTRMGLVYTDIYPEGMSLKGGRVTRENFTTAREMSMLLEEIYRGELVDRQSSETMLEILRKKKAVQSRLAKGLPPGWEIAHKTGLLRHSCHDSAIFLTPDGDDYLMTVLTGDDSNYRAAKNFITRLGHVTFRYLGPAPRYYAMARRPRRTYVR